MASKEKNVRQSVTLPAKVATQVRSMAKRRRLSANRMLVELIEEALEAKKQKEKDFRTRRTFSRRRRSPRGRTLRVGVRANGLRPVNARAGTVGKLS